MKWQNLGLGNPSWGMLGLKKRPCSGEKLMCYHCSYVLVPRWKGWFLWNQVLGPSYLWERSPRALGSFFEKIQAKSILKKKKSKVKFLIFSKNQLKNMFFCLENASKKESRESLTKVWRKFHWNFRGPSESFSETFGETFAGHTKVWWNFRSPYESFMKLSSGHRKFHETFIWPPKVSVKLSPNFRVTLFSMRFLGKKKHVFQLIFWKNEKFHLGFFQKNAFRLNFLKQLLFHWFFKNDSFFETFSQK
jgi:hypothetical protein